MASKVLDCANTRYSFELPVKAYADKDSILIGDTIWFEVNSPSTFTDRLSGEQIDYSKAGNLGSGIVFSGLSSTGEFTINSVSKFDYILKEGKELRRGYSDDLGNEYLFIEKYNKYRFLLGITPKFKGTYSIIFSNASNVYRTSDNCTKAGFEINFKDTDQNFYLAPGYDPNGPQSGGGVYYFKVI